MPYHLLTHLLLLLLPQHTEGETTADEIAETTADEGEDTTEISADEKEKSEYELDDAGNSVKKASPPPPSPPPEPEPEPPKGGRCLVSSQTLNP